MYTCLISYSIIHMKSILTLSFFIIQAISIAQIPGKFLKYGGTQNDLSYGTCKGSGTSFYTSGYFSGTVTMGNSTLVSSGAEDMYIAKHDSSGQVIWARKAGGTNSDMSFSISYNNGYAYVTGVFRGTATFGSTVLISSGQADGFLAKYDDNGNLIWAKKAGASSSEDRTDEITFENGNIMYMCASYVDGAMYDGMLLTGNGGVDAFILKLDTAGNLLKYMPIGGTSNDYTFDLKLMNGSLYIAGDFYSNTIDFGLGMTENNQGSYDGFVAKYDTALNVIWGHAGGGSGLDDFQKLIVDANGNCYVTGYFTNQATYNGVTINSTVAGKNDACIAKYDATGTLKWVKNIGAHDMASGREIKLGETENEITLYGNFGAQLDNNGQNIVSKGGIDGFVLKYDSTGNVTSMYTFGGVADETVCEVAKTGNKVWISGGFNGVSLFDTVSLTTTGAYDIGLWEFVSPLPTTSLANILADKAGFAMYPNPSRNILLIKGEETIQSIEIFNLTGEKVYSVQPESKQFSFEHELNNGFYFVVLNGDYQTAQKLLIQK